MTSKAKTHYWPRAETAAGAASQYSVSDRLAVAAFGAISWPWLLRSLDGGSSGDRRALLTRLGLPDDALPNLGSWKADASFLNVVADTIFELRPALVVELGAGATTLVASRCLEMNGAGALVSFDAHEEFASATREWVAEYGLRSDIRHAPLTARTPAWPGRWYDVGDLPRSIDLLIIDGPHWGVHPLVRGGADKLFGKIAVGGVVLLDDAARPGERIIAHIWKKRWPDFDFREIGGAKGTLVGVRAR